MEGIHRVRNEGEGFSAFTSRRHHKHVDTTRWLIVVSVRVLYYSTTQSPKAAAAVEVAAMCIVYVLV